MAKKRFKHNIIQVQRKPLEEGKPIVLGVTGGIACGKSFVSRCFQELGATVLSADELAREVVTPKSGPFNQIVAHFGLEILTTEGAIDRVRLGKKIFQSLDAREQLNRIMYPAIRQLAERRIQELRSNKEIQLIIYEAPLLFEAKAETRVDFILVVATSVELQIKRLMHRDNLSRDDALQRISAQMPLAEKIDRADILVINNGSIAETRKLILSIFCKLTSIKKNPPMPEDFLIIE